MPNTGLLSMCSIDLCCGRLIIVLIPRTCGYVNYTVKGALQTRWRVSRWGHTPGLYKVGLKLSLQKTKIMASGLISSWQIDGETTETVRGFILGGSKITADGDCSHEIKRCLLLGRKNYDQPRQHVKKQRHCFANKGPSSQSFGFSSSHVWMWELDYKESWALKNWCFWTVVLEKTLESPLDCKEIQPPPT